MKVHHLDCVSQCPLSARITNGEGPWLSRGRLVTHCLLVESRAGLVLVDTGIGTAAIDHPGQFGRVLGVVPAPTTHRQQTALHRVRALGLDDADVRHLVVTHLDLDHAGGLPDFPHATVHVHADEHQVAMTPPDFRSKRRYLKRQWAHDVRWQLHRPDGERWFGFEAVRAIEGLDDEVLLVPLAGHSPGHCAVAVRGPDGWLLHCGDAYFHRGEVHAGAPPCSPGLWGFANVVQHNRRQRRHNVARLRELAASHGDEVCVFSAHDPHEFDALKAAAGTVART